MPLRTLLLVLLSLALAAAPASAKPRAIDAQHSMMTIHLFKQGLLSFAADNHDVNAPIVGGSFDDATKALDLTIDVARLKALDSKLPPARQANVEADMMGPNALDVGKYPTISFRSLQIDGNASDRWTLTGNLTLHGQTHPIVVQAFRVDAAHLSGSTTVRQSAFGITPARAAAGMVRVKDDVKVEFNLALAP